MEQFKTFEEFIEEDYTSVDSTLYVDENFLIIESNEGLLIYEGFGQEFFNSLFAWNEVTNATDVTKSSGFMGLGGKTRTANTQTHTELGLSPMGATLLAGVVLTIVSGIVGYKYIKQKNELAKKFKKEKELEAKEALRKEIQELEAKEAQEIKDAQEESIKAKEVYDKKIRNMDPSKKEKFLKSSAKFGKRISDSATSALKKLKGLSKDLFKPIQL